LKYFGYVVPCKLLDLVLSQTRCFSNPLDFIFDLFCDLQMWSRAFGRFIKFHYIWPLKVDICLYLENFQWWVLFGGRFSRCQTHVILRLTFFNVNVKGQKHGKVDMNFVCPCVEIEFLDYVEHKWRTTLDLVVGKASHCFDLGYSRGCKSIAN
jgi:hypothetical protein